MLQQELIDIIEKYCKGKEPTDAQIDEIMDKALVLNADVDEVATMMEELHNLPAQEEPKEKNTPGEVEAGVPKENEKTVAMPPKPLENKTGEERDNQKTNRKRKTKANRDSERVELIEEEAEPKEENEIQKKIDQRLKEVEEAFEEKYREIESSRKKDIRNVREEIVRNNKRGLTRILKYVGLGFVLIFVLALALPFEMALFFGIGISIILYWKRNEE